MAKVLFKRIADSSLIDDYDIEDGSFWVTGDGKTFIDYNGERISIAGTPDTEMSDRSTNSVQNNVVKSYVDTSIANIKPKILWTNPNPTTGISGQTITLASNDCDMLLWIIKRTADADFLISATIINEYNVFMNTVTGGGLTARKGATYLGNNVYEIGQTTLGDGTQDNNYLVPLYVIGYNTGLFS